MSTSLTIDCFPSRAAHVSEYIRKAFTLSSVVLSVFHLFLSCAHMFFTLINVYNGNNYKYLSNNKLTTTKVGKKNLEYELLLLYFSSEFRYADHAVITLSSMFSPLTSV